MPKNFIPELWAEKIMRELDNEHYLVKNCTRKWSGKIEGKGSRVKINSINEPTIRDYDPDAPAGTKLQREKIKDESRWLEITEAKYFNIQLEMVEGKQGTGGELEEAIRKGTVGFADVADAFIASKYVDSASTVTQAALTSGNFFSTFMKGKRKLMRVGKVNERTAVVAEVTPEVWEKGVLAEILYNNQNNEEVIRKGQYVQSLGMTFYVSNNIPVNETNEDVVQQNCNLRTKEAMGYAEQIMKVKQYEPDDEFAEAAKALHVYGAKMIKPRESVLMNLTTAAETEI